MGWSQAFVDALGARVRRPRFVVKSLRGFGMPLEGTAVRWSSHAEPGYEQVLTRDCRLSHGSLTPGSWTVSASSLEVGLGHGVTLTNLRPGLMCQLLMGFDGWDVEDYEPVFTGMLVGVDYSGRRYRARFTGIEGCLHGRWGVGGIYPTVPTVFSGAGTETTLDVAFTPGVSTELDFATSVEPLRATGGLYTVQITNTAGGTFYVQGSSVSTPSFGVTRLSGLSYGLLNSSAPSGSFPSGSAVVYLVHDEQHPLRIAQRLVTSTGYGVSSEDVYPAEWGLGVPSSAVDADDWSAQRVLAGPLGLSSPSWHLLQEAPAMGFAQWLSSYLADAACWLCQRQGRLTGRALQPQGSQPVSLYPTDSDIIEIRARHFGGSVEHADVWVTDQGARSSSIPHPFSPFAEMEDKVARIIGALTPVLPPIPGPSGTRTTAVGLDFNDFWGRPMSPQVDMILPVFGTVSDRRDWRENVRDRVLPWMTRRVEGFDVTLAGLGWGQVAIGDAVGIITGQIDGRRGANDFATKGGQHIVVGGGLDPFRGVTELQTVYVPEVDDG